MPPEIPCSSVHIATFIGNGGKTLALLDGPRQLQQIDNSKEIVQGIEIVGTNLSILVDTEMR